MSFYGQRAQTRSDHLGKIAAYLEWKTAPAGSEAMKELEQFLIDRAMEHDSPTLLFNLAREYLSPRPTSRAAEESVESLVGPSKTPNALWSAR